MDKDGRYRPQGEKWNGMKALTDFSFLFFVCSFVPIQCEADIWFCDMEQFCHKKTAEHFQQNICWGSHAWMNTGTNTRTHTHALTKYTYTNWVKPSPITPIVSSGVCIMCVCACVHACVCVCVCVCAYKWEQGMLLSALSAVSHY